jgi:IS5 family transposase
MPRQVSADEGFASKDNRAHTREHGVKDAVFSKKRRVLVFSMAKSIWVYKTLRNRRAGIEAGASALKLSFGLDRCNWKGWNGCGRYAWSSVASSNLLALAGVKVTKRPEPLEIEDNQHYRAGSAA